VPAVDIKSVKNCSPLRREEKIESLQVSASFSAGSIPGSSTDSQFDSRQLHWKQQVMQHHGHSSNARQHFRAVGVSPVDR
jgi:hypothetical protein